jgi:hypothetical protein
MHAHRPNNELRSELKNRTLSKPISLGNCHYLTFADRPAVMGNDFLVKPPKRLSCLPISDAAAETGTRILDEYATTKRSLPRAVDHTEAERSSAGTERPRRICRRCTKLSLSRAIPAQTDIRRHASTAPDRRKSALRLRQDDFAAHH